MIRILVQQWEGRTAKSGYIRSYQFSAADRIEDDLALEMLLDWLRTSKILVESKHKEREDI